jgi:hypothetical protein
MKSYRTSHGPFAEGVFYTDSDIETICLDELSKVGLLPIAPQRVRIDRFIEKRFNVVPSYEDLPEGVLGLTRFGSAGVEEVVIARSLDRDSSTSAERRIRSTLAHEGGHGLLHSHLFALSADRQIFADYTEPLKPRVLCRDGSDGTMAGSYKGQWWEFQANRTIGGLLLPKSLVAIALEEFMVEAGNLGLRCFDFSQRQEASRVLAEVFDVNAAVAHIRIDQLFQASSAGQLTL